MDYVDQCARGTTMAGKDLRLTFHFSRALSAWETERRWQSFRKRASGVKQKVNIFLTAIEEAMRFQETRF